MPSSDSQGDGLTHTSDGTVFVGQFTSTVTQVWGSGWRERVPALLSSVFCASVSAGRAAEVLPRIKCSCLDRSMKSFPAPTPFKYF